MVGSDRDLRASRAIFEAPDDFYEFNEFNECNEFDGFEWIEDGSLVFGGGKARLVNRKRRIVCREEKIGREEKGNGKRSRVMEEDAYYLKMNTENLQALKAHLESVKLKEKELKQKKHKRKV